MNDFIDGPKKVGGLHFRPFTVGSKNACKQMGLSFFLTGEQLSEEEMERQMIAFSWLHSAEPLEEVLAAIRNGTADIEAQKFGFQMPIGASPELVKEINRISKAAAENSVEVMQKPGTKDDSPGN